MSGFTIFASKPRTANENSPDFGNSYGRGIALYLDVTAASGTLATLDVKLQAKDAASGAYFDMTGLAFPQVLQAQVPLKKILRISPGITVVANDSISDVVPEDWRAVAMLGGTNPSFTFSLGGQYTR